MTSPSAPDSPSYDSSLNAPGTSKPQEQGGAAVQPSGAKGDNPATAGPGHTGVDSRTPENKQGHLNPSAPEDSNVTPGSASRK